MRLLSPPHPRLPRRPVAVVTAAALAMLLISGGTTVVRETGSRPAFTIGLAAAHGGARPVHRTRLLVIGGSIAAGYFATTAARGYPRLLARRLRTKRESVGLVLRAASGATVAEALKWPVMVRSDIVTVQIATNDFSRSVPLSRFGAGYRTLLGRIRRASPRARLACTGVWFDPSARNSSKITAAAYNVVVHRLCLRAHGHYADLAAIYLNPADRGPAGRRTYLGPADDFHPNDRGHALIAAALLRALRS